MLFKSHSQLAFLTRTFDFLLQYRDRTTITKLTGEMYKLRMNVNLISNVLGKCSYISVNQVSIA